MTSRDLFARSRELRLKLAKDMTTQAAITPLPPLTTTEASSDSQDAVNNLSFGTTSSPRTSSSRPLSSSGRGTDSDSSFHYVNSNVTKSPVSVSNVPVLASEGFRIKGAAEAVASWKKDTEGEFGSSAYEEASSFVTAPSSSSENILSSNDPSPIPTPAQAPLTPTDPLLSTASSKFPDIAKLASSPSTLPQSSTSLADLSIATGKSEIDHAEISKWKGLYEIAVKSKESLKTELEGKLEISEGVRVGIQDELKKLLIGNSALKEELGQMKGKVQELEGESQENKRCLDEAIGEILRQEEEGARLEEELKRSIADFEEKKLELQERNDEIQTIKDVAAKSTAELLEKHLQDLQRWDHLQKEMDKLSSEKDILAAEKIELAGKNSHLEGRAHIHEKLARKWGTEKDLSDVTIRADNIALAALKKENQVLKEEVSEVRKELDELQEEFGSFMAALEDQDQNIPATPVDVQVDREKSDKEDLHQPQEGNGEEKNDPNLLLDTTAAKLPSVDGTIASASRILAESESTFQDSTAENSPIDHHPLTSTPPVSKSSESAPEPVEITAASSNSQSGGEDAAKRLKSLESQKETDEVLRLAEEWLKDTESEE